MAGIAISEFRASWVIHADADEFWWPRGHDDLPACLREVSGETEGLVVRRTNFVLPVGFDESLPFHAQMFVRERDSLNILGSPLPPKVCHRNLHGVVIGQGNHSFSVAGRDPLTRLAENLEVLHFPYRGYRQFRDKIRLGGAAYARNHRLPPNMGGCWRRLYELEQVGRLAEFYRAQAKSAVEMEAGIAHGAYEPFHEFSRHMAHLMGDGSAHREPMVASRRTGSD